MMTLDNIFRQNSLRELAAVFFKKNFIKGNWKVDFEAPYSKSLSNERPLICRVFVNNLLKGFFRGIRPKDL